MEYMIPLMPLFGALPVAAAAVWITHRVLRYRERRLGASEAIEQLRDELDQLRRAHGEMQERLDFTERVLAQMRNPQQIRAAE